MPVDLLQTQRQVREKSKQAGLRLSELNQRKGQARGLFEACCEDIKGLTARVEKALEKNAALRCAVPFSDALHCTFPSPAVGGAVVVMAADGSQIVPSRHDRVEFGVINTGIFRMETGGDAANPPTEIINSRLLYGDDLEAHGKPINEDLIALWRDLDERRNLVEMAARETLPVAALTDGPLELYQEPKQQEEFTALFQDYLFEMRKMASLNIVMGGYVDKPRADLVVRLMELAALEEKDLEQAGRFHPFRGVTDFDLFSPLLQPGERSAVLKIQSMAARNYTDELALYFFYLNVGSAGRAALARVEIAAWVANDPQKVERLHGVLVEQCDRLGNRPYPYALHRAHEVAVVRREEKQAIEEMIVAELLRLGIPVGEKSYKQTHKENSGSRTRYKK